jgi:hypothetical protein
MQSTYKCDLLLTKVKVSIVSTAILCAAITLSGCASGTNAIDDAITTSAISIADSTPTISTAPFSEPDAQTDASTSDKLLDEDTIRLAVTAADLSKIPSDGLSWANEATGSSGSITNLAQRVEAGQSCRSFNATRTSYDGVTLYQGDVCLDKRSGWWTRSLEPVS